MDHRGGVQTIPLRYLRQSRQSRHPSIYLGTRKQDPLQYFVLSWGNYLISPLFLTNVMHCFVFFYVIIKSVRETNILPFFENFHAHFFFHAHFQITNYIPFFAKVLSIFYVFGNCTETMKFSRMENYFFSRKGVTIFQEKKTIGILKLFYILSN